MKSLPSLLELAPSYCHSCCTNGHGCVCNHLVAELKIIFIETWCDGALRWSFVNPIIPGNKYFQSAAAYGNASMLSYMLDAAYNLLYVSLLHVLDTIGTNW